MSAKSSNQKKGDAITVSLCLISFAIAFACILQFSYKELPDLFIRILDGFSYLWKIAKALIRLDPLPLLHFLASPYGFLILAMFFIYLGMRFLEIIRRKKK